MDFGTIITVVFVLLFYLRLILMQWGKAKRAKLAYEASKAKGKTPQNSTIQLGVHFSNKYLLVLGIALIVFGAVLAALPSASPTLKSLWWVPLNLGVLIFIGIVRA